MNGEAKEVLHQQRGDEEHPRASEGYAGRLPVRDDHQDGDLRQGSEPNTCLHENGLKERAGAYRWMECVSPARNRWRIRWDVQEREDGSASYMEEGFVGRPHMDTIKSVITDWCNEQIDREILSGFLYEGMPVWLSSENQFNYKAAYDLAVQTGGATLPVTFKFGTDEVPQYREFVTLEELTDFYTKAMKHVQDTLSDGWRKKDAFDPEKYRVE